MTWSLFLHRTGEKGNSIFCHFAIYNIHIANVIVSNCHLKFNSRNASYFQDPFRTTSSLHLRTFYYFQLHSRTFPHETCSCVMEMLVTAEDRQQTVTLKQTARPAGRNPSKVRNIGTQGGKSPVWISPGSCTPHPPPFSREHAGTLPGVETFMIVALEFALINNVKSRQPLWVF